MRSAPPDQTIVADGFSCRTQIAHLDGSRAPVHTAQVLAAALSASNAGAEQHHGRRRGLSKAGPAMAGLAGVGLLTAGLAAVRRRQ